MDLLKCIVELLPGWKGGVVDNSYDKITPSVTETRQLPALSVLEAVWPTIQAREAEAKTQEMQKLSLKETAISQALPTWTQTAKDIDAITNLAEAKVFIMRLSKVVYWLVKDKAD